MYIYYSFFIDLFIEIYYIYYKKKYIIDYQKDDVTKNNKLKKK